MKPDTCIEGKVMIALLAAGESRRFGGVKLAQSLSSEANELACEQAGASLISQPTETLIGHQYQALHEVANRLGATLVVVTGAHHQAIASCLPPSATLLHNPDWQGGLGHSIAAAAREAKARRAETLLIALGDQVKLGTEDYLGLFRARARANTRVCAYYELTLGAPALFHYDDFEALSSLSGDRGAKALLSRRYQEGNLIAMAMENASVDIDTRSQLMAYLARSKAGAQ
ncbi:NTP transferase domain-containing protein [Shewanella aquimarina]|uniref:nucleotidyltransferase family protein n=1 Tax=Shewanella aquimarina TaxID=260365 RepID=UPI002014E1B3|nr:NTP transferase domain-containing protein [Shewanella aquimarina]MCL2911167.1 NTP transferase domain-containing protein [Shewanella aquimarina]